MCELRYANAYAYVQCKPGLSYTARLDWLWGVYFSNMLNLNYWNKMAMMMMMMMKLTTLTFHLVNAAYYICKTRVQVAFLN